MTTSVDANSCTTSLNLRARTKKGIIKIHNLTSKSTLNDLKKAISDMIGVDQKFIRLLKGYPPKQLDNSNENSTLGSNQIKDGEMFTVQEESSSQVVKNVDDGGNQQVKESESSKRTSNRSGLGEEGVLLRKVVPANNSCLFTSINFVMENGQLNLDCQKSMRELIARIVKQDPVFYNEGILGKKNSDYCDWIRNSTSWGGSIEVMIFSKHFKIEICVVDIRTGRIDKFGEDCSYSTRVFIIYDGIHFDPLYLESSTSSSSKIQTKFSTNDDIVLAQAISLAIEAKNARQYTDVANFKLRCLSCQQPLKGQNEAQQHAEKFGHTNFGEI